MERHRWSFRAAIFDLDGVITQSARIHLEAWKTVFNELLASLRHQQQRPRETMTHRDPDNNTTLRDFTDDDYYRYVDGIPRYEGVRTFLHSRHLDNEIPYGGLLDSDNALTMCGIGNKKNTIFNRLVQQQGVDVYPSSLQLLTSMKESGIPTAVASSSKNCPLILRKLDLERFFDVQMDGNKLEQLQLRGKPFPDMFLRCVDLLRDQCHVVELAASECVLFEDAVQGVEAAQSGRFGLIVGINRGEKDTGKLALKNAGADTVVDDMAELGQLHDLDRLFTKVVHPKGYPFQRE